jgi:hypothetical protein
VDEGNNWINLRWGPLTLVNPTSQANPMAPPVLLGNYAPAAGSPVIDYVVSGGPTYAAAPSTDFFGNARKTDSHVDVGAVEVASAQVAVASVTGTLAFGNVPVGTTSASRTLTLSNTGTAGLTGIALTFTGPYSRAAAGGTCTPTLAAGATCTINVVFSPTALGSAPGSVAIAASVTVTGSPVAASGTGIAAVVSASLTPTSQVFANETRSATACTTPDYFVCSNNSLFVFTLTNTGNVPLTGITQGVLGGTNPTEFNVDRLISNCGPNGAGQFAGPNTTLAPGATCFITVGFHPLTSQTTGLKTATISVTDSAGTQTSSPLSGTAQ